MASFENGKISITGIAQNVVGQIEAELPSRSIRVANALMRGKNMVLRGEGHGRWYGNHHASAVGEHPATWTGNFRGHVMMITNDAHLPAIEFKEPYAVHLEYGTKRMGRRPFKEPIIEYSKPDIEAIMSEPWHIKP